MKDEKRGKNKAPHWLLRDSGSTAGFTITPDEAEALAPMIRPNYREVRDFFVRICFFGSLIVLAFQIALYIIFKYHLLPLEFKTSETVHLMVYLVIPSVINFAVVILAWQVNRRDKAPEFVLNAVPIFAMTTICSVTATAHSVYSITLMLPCLPIFMVSIYGMRRILYLTASMCAVGLVPAVISRAFSPYYTTDTKFVPEVIAAYAVLLTCTMISMVLIRLLNTQKDRLFQAKREAEAARQQAQEANLAKSEFLANMSHEIRPPSTR